MLTPPHLHHKNTSAKSTSVLGPDVAERRKARELPRKLDLSAWAGCCSVTSFLVKTRSRALRNTDQYENFHEK